MVCLYVSKMGNPLRRSTTVVKCIISKNIKHFSLIVVGRDNGKLK